MKYSEAVLARVRDPSRGGSLDPGAPGIVTGLARATVCADVTRFQVQVDSDGRILAARFQTFGCAPAVAAAQRLAERVEGLTGPEALALTPADLAADLDLAGPALHGPDLAIQALAAALS